MAWLVIKKATGVDSDLRMQPKIERLCKPKVVVKHKDRSHNQNLLYSDTMLNFGSDLTQSYKTCFERIN